MNFVHHYRNFDTNIDTNIKSVSVTSKFIIRRKFADREKGLVYLFISANGERERINLKINIDVKEWNKTTQRLKPTSTIANDVNLIIDDVQSKITAVCISYRLQDRELSVADLRKELETNAPSFLFCSFMENAMEIEKHLVSRKTYYRYVTVLNKVKEFDSKIRFSDLDLNWIKKFKSSIKSKGKMKSTVASNVAVIKKFLGIAQNNNIKLAINPKDIVIESTRGNRNSLSVLELRKCLEYYHSPFINPEHRLILGYFLFSCMTGLRISDVLKTTRKDLIDKEITFIAEKTTKDQSITLNKTARLLIQSNEQLFVKFFSEKHINLTLKTIMLNLGITKIVSFHVARHTFATSFLRAGGQVEKLQKLLGHQNISETMIYVHIVQAEANKEIFLLDNLFD